MDRRQVGRRHRSIDQFPTQDEIRSTLGHPSCHQIHLHRYLAIGFPQTGMHQRVHLDERTMGLDRSGLQDQHRNRNLHRNLCIHIGRMLNILDYQDNGQVGYRVCCPHNHRNRDLSIELHLLQKHQLRSVHPILNRYLTIHRNRNQCNLYDRWLRYLQ